MNNGILKVSEESKKTIEAIGVRLRITIQGESFVFGNAGGYSFTYHAVVISAVKDAGIVKNDKVYTPKSTSIAFNPLSNDLASSYPVTSHSPELTRDSAGIFHYTPPTNFEGVKNFYYKVKYGYTTETGKIAMNVGNYISLPVR